MTAIAERRRRTTLLGFVGIVVLMLGAVAMFVVGVLTLSNSQEGEAVGVETRPITALPVTPNALLVVEGDDGSLVSLTVLTLLPDGTGGSIVSVPVNADATAAFGVQRRPLDELYGVDDLDGFTETVQEMLSITIERSEVIAAADLGTLFPGVEGADLVSAASASDEQPDSTDPETTDPETTDPDDYDRPGYDRSHGHRPAEHRFDCGRRTRHDGRADRDRVEHGGDRGRRRRVLG